MVDEGLVELHPPEITNADRMTAKNMNQRICITGKVHPK